MEYCGTTTHVEKVQEGDKCREITVQQFNLEFVLRDENGKPLPYPPNTAPDDNGVIWNRPTRHAFGFIEQDEDDHQTIYSVITWYKPMLAELNHLLETGELQEMAKKAVQAKTLAHL